ncbi:zinc ribbon domain-containing protein [Psychromonas ossibalaenae]|uniref:zinc ribbon domain-containing protein n=1 Tax=Psychromonas ossibalaenae TaxID=444922 RepID=UPI00037E798D|nr:zinc ribbon domain-containing protein [Psychromonas ossibalaenae]
MELQCPKCTGELARSGVLKRRCEACDSDFKLHAACDKCGDELERLQACGAVNFWCHSCNELKSKSTAVYTLQEI